MTIRNNLMKGALTILFTTVMMAGAIGLHAADSKPVIDTGIGRPAQLKSEPRLVGIMNLAAFKIISRHYSRTPVDSNLSAGFFKEYLRTLDPNRIFFTEPEIAHFRSLYEFKLADYIRTNNPKMLDFAFDAYNLLTVRLHEYYDYANEVAAIPADFTSTDTFLVDRREAPWAKDMDELRTFWRQRTLNDILTDKIVARSAAERQRADSPLAEIKPWSQENAANASRKRIKQLCAFFDGRSNMDIAEFYITAFAKVFDPHSGYMAPKSEAQFNIQMSLQLIGIGAGLIVDDGYIKIDHLIPGGPAALSKLLKVGDRIVGVAEGDSDYVDLVNMPLDQAVERIRGKEKTTVRLSVIDGAAGAGGTPNEISLVREKVVLKEAEARADSFRIDDGKGGTLLIGMISLPSFYRDFNATNGAPKNAYEDVKKLLLQLKDAKIDGLIFDLRSNGGGALPDAIYISGLFIRTGTVVQIRDNNNNVERANDIDPAIQYDGPLIIMQNKFSASASEIFAAAMQDYHRAIIVGDKESHGKGTVQQVEDLNRFAQAFNLTPPIGAVKFTQAKFYRANGETTQLQGVRPDIVFPSFTEHIESGESSLEHALPFDTIISANPESYIPDYDKTVADLRDKSLTRMVASEKFKVLREQIDFLGEIRKQKWLSLNEETRWQLYRKEKEINDRQAELLRIDAESGEPIEGDDTTDSDKAGAVEKKNDDKKKKDIYLDETLNIMRDLVDIEKNRSPKP